MTSMPVPAYAADNEAPVVAALVPAEERLDITTDPATLTVSARLEDVGSGVAGTPQLRTTVGSYRLPIVDLELASGDRNKGLWRADVPLDVTMPGGTYAVRVVGLVDAAGNQGTSEVATVQVTATPDTTAPRVVEASPPWASFADVSDGLVEIPVRVVVTDDRRLDFDTLMEVWVLDSRLGGVRSGPLTVTRIDDTRVELSGTVTVDRADAGGNDLRIGTVRDAAGNSFSGHTAVVVVEHEPKAPGRPRLSSDSAPTLTWTPPEPVTEGYPANIDGYRVRFAPSAQEGADPVVIETSTTTLDHAALAVVPAGRYVVTVQAGNTYGWGAWSSELSELVVDEAGVITLDAVFTNDAPPTIVGEPRVGEPLLAGDGSWHPLPLTLDHQWLRDGQPIDGADEAGYTPIVDDIGARLSVRVTAAAPGVRSTSATSAPTAPVEAGRPDSPTEVTVRPIAADAATVMWEAPADNGAPITSYVVSAGPGIGRFTVDGDARSLTVQKLGNGREHVFAVAAVNAVGESTPSANVAATQPDGVPGAVTDIAVRSGDGEGWVSWTQAESPWAPVVSYTVFFGPVLRKTVPGDRTSLHLPKLANGADYQVQIVAETAYGYGPSVRSSEPLAPVGLPNVVGTVTTVVKGRKVVVRWPKAYDGGLPLTRYVVHRKGGAKTKVAPDRRKMVLKKQRPGTHKYRVRAVNSAGAGPWSRYSAAAWVSR